MIVGRENIIDFFKGTRCNAWQIYSGQLTKDYQKKTPKSAEFSERDASPEQAVTELRNYLNRVGYGNFTLKYTKDIREGDKACWTHAYQQEFHIDQQEYMQGNAIGSKYSQSAQAAAGIPSGMITIEQHEKELKRQKEHLEDKHKQDLRINDLEKKVKEKQSIGASLLNNPVLINSLVDIVKGLRPQPVIAGYKDGGHLPPVQAKQTVVNSDTEEARVEVTFSDEQNARLSQVVSEMLPLTNYNVDELLRLLERVKDKAIENPALLSFLQ